MDAAFRGESEPEVCFLVEAASGDSVDFGPQRDVKIKSMFVFAVFFCRTQPV